MCGFVMKKTERMLCRILNLEVKQGEFYALGRWKRNREKHNFIPDQSCPGSVSRKDPAKWRLISAGIQILSSTEAIWVSCRRIPRVCLSERQSGKILYSIIGGAKEKKSPEYTASMKKAEAIEGIVSLTRLEGLLDRHPYDLSGGEQQRLALAKVLLLQPRLLLMDEPTKGLDAEYKQELGEILKKLQEHGITIFMISHDVEFVAEYADRVGLFFQGNVVTSKPAARNFFAGNSFYTTAANRMARHYFPDAVTGKEVAACLKERL